MDYNKKRAQRTCFWTYNFRSISEEPQPPPPKKIFWRPRSILDDKTQAVFIVRQPKDKYSQHHDHLNFKEKYRGLVFYDTFVIFGPSLGLSQIDLLIRVNNTAKLKNGPLVSSIGLSFCEHLRGLKN